MQDHVKYNKSKTKTKQNNKTETKRNKTKQNKKAKKERKKIKKHLQVSLNFRLKTIFVLSQILKVLLNTHKYKYDIKTKNEMKYYR